MNHSFEYVTSLEYRLKAALNKIVAFESGEKYVQGIIRGLESEIKSLKQELAKAHAETVKVRNYWFDVADDMEREKQKELSKAEKL